MVATGAVLLDVDVAGVVSYNIVTGWDGARQATDGTGQNGTSAGRSRAGKAIAGPNRLLRDGTSA